MKRIFTILLIMMALVSSANAWPDNTTSNTGPIIIVYPGWTTAVDVSILNNNFSNLVTGLHIVYPTNGTKNADTWLCGDNTWKTPSGGGDMAKSLYDTNENDIADTSDAFQSFTNQGYVDLVPTNGLSHKEGRIFYDSDHKLPSAYTDINGVTLNIGDEMFRRVHNNTGATISNGVVVYTTGVTNGASHTSDLIGKADADDLTKIDVLGMATHDIPDGSNGWVTSIGKVHDVDTSAFSAVNDTVYLSDTAGEISATAGTYAVVLGKVKKVNATTGIIDFRLGGTTALPAQTGKLTDGMAIERQSLVITNDGSSKLYAEIDDTSSGGDMYFTFNAQTYTLDCTTGAGAGGNAQSFELTAGTDTSPTANYLFVVPGTFPAAVLTNSTTYPSGQFAWIGKVVLQSYATTTNAGPLMLQRTSDNLAHDGRGALSYDRERIRQLPAHYDSGCAVTVTDDAAGNVTLSVASGVVYQMHRQTFSAVSDPAEMYVINDNSTPYTTITNFNQITADADGDAIGNNKYFAVRIYGGIASGDSGVSRLFVSLPTEIYGSAAGALTGIGGDVNNVPADLLSTSFSLARVVLKKVSAGDYELVAGGNQDIRGAIINATSSGAGSAQASSFPDNNFEITDDTDSSKILKFQASGISGSTTRTLTAQDKDYTIANHDDLITNAFAEVIQFNSLAGIIRQGTSDGSDTRYLVLSGGGSSGNTRGGYIEIFGNEFSTVANQTGNVHIVSGEAGLVKIASQGSANWGLIVSNDLTQMRNPGLTELSADPADPPEGESRIWLSDGTGSGDDGDIMVKQAYGGSFETNRFLLDKDFSNASRFSFFVYTTNTQSIATATFTEIVFNGEYFDYGNCHSTSTGRFTPTVAGVYFCSANVSINGISDGKDLRVSLVKNGTERNCVANFNTDSAAIGCLTVSALFHCNGTTDYIAVEVRHAEGVNKDTYQWWNSFRGFLVSED